MRVFVVGASGAIGTRLVPQLLDREHEVIGTATSPARAERVSALGAEVIVLDLLDPRAVREAVLAARPDAIVHEATALANLSDFKHFDRSFAQTNRLRTEGTDALLAAARETGVRRFVAQSYASARYAREGVPVDVSGERGGTVVGEVGDDHLSPFGGESPDRRFTEPGGAAEDDRRGSRDVHVFVLLSVLVASDGRGAGGDRDHLDVHVQRRLRLLPPVEPRPRRKSLGEKIGSLFQGWAVKAAGQMRPVAVPSHVHIA